MVVLLIFGIMLSSGISDHDASSHFSQWGSTINSQVCTPADMTIGVLEHKTPTKIRFKGNTIKSPRVSRVTILL